MHLPAALGAFGFVCFACLASCGSGELAAREASAAQDLRATADGDARDAAAPAEAGEPDLASRLDAASPADLPVDDLATADLVVVYLAGPDLAARAPNFHGPCGMQLACAPPKGVCCFDAVTLAARCVADPAGCNGALPYTCRDGSDCAPGEECCHEVLLVHCVARGTCAGNRLCAIQADCGNNASCCFTAGGFQECHPGICP